MSGFQFIHIEPFGRVPGNNKTGNHCLSTIVMEAERVAGSCPHVQAPAAPQRLYGCSPSAAGEQAVEWAEQATDALGRKLRKDGLCLLSGVVSMPRDRLSDWPSYKAAVVHWLTKHYGDRLRSVVEHTDEAHPHLHFYVVPRFGERFEMVHDGRAAARVAKDRGERKGQQNLAYREAMRAWLSNFHSQVAIRFALTRIGPGRRRLTRQQWRMEQLAAKALADAAYVREENFELARPLAPTSVISAELLDIARRDVGAGKRGFLGGETFSREQLDAAMHATAVATARAARADERRRLKPIFDQAGMVAGAAIAEKRIKAQFEQIERESSANAFGNSLLRQLTPKDIAILRAREEARGLKSSQKADADTVDTVAVTAPKSTVIGDNVRDMARNPGSSEPSMDIPL
jgi:hypothetical protein